MEILGSRALQVWVLSFSRYRNGKACVCWGEMASKVWHFVGDAVGISWIGSSFRVCIAAWWYGKRGNRDLAFVHHILPLLVCWHLWKFRNARKYEGV